MNELMNKISGKGWNECRTGRRTVNCKKGVMNLPKTVTGWVGTWAKAGRVAALRLFCASKTPDAFFGSLILTTLLYEESLSLFLWMRKMRLKNVTYCPGLYVSIRTGFGTHIACL